MDRLGGWKIDRAHFDPRQRAFWRNLFRVVIFNTLLAGLLSLIKFGPWRENLVFSQCIGLLIWAGAMCAGIYTRTLWMKLAGLGLAVVGGTVLGEILAATILGYPLRGLLAHFSRNWALAFAIPVVATLLNAYYFWTRERLARMEAELAAQQAEKSAQEQEAARALVVAELAALQAQIEPHFLFNTLANLRSLIGRDPATAQRMLDRLITYLRSTLHTARARTATLADEFAQLSAYLEIQGIRMGERLRFQVTLPPALAQIHIPPMLLQPLVENAIRHGIEPKVGGGVVILSARAQAGQLVLTVEDDGIGFGVSDTAGASVGLTNVRERLRALFGDNAQLAIESPPAGGVRVTLTLPETEPCPPAP